MSFSQKKGFYRNYAKRGLDVVLSFFALVFLSPILLAVYILLRIVNGKEGAFFFQERPSMDERIFRIMKFKTMTDRKDANGHLLPDAERLTRTGRFVRSASIYELPQRWNVLRGDMSLIGPRPLLPQYLPLYNNIIRSRLGDTRFALASLAGRNVTVVMPSLWQRSPGLMCGMQTMYHSRPTYK